MSRIFCFFFGHKSYFNATTNFQPITLLVNIIYCDFARNQNARAHLSLPSVCAIDWIMPKISKIISPGQDFERSSKSITFARHKKLHALVRFVLFCFVISFVCAALLLPFAIVFINNSKRWPFLLLDLIVTVLMTCPARAHDRLHVYGQL